MHNGLMMLLRFEVTNHRSLRDRAELDLRKPSLDTLRPRDGDAWADHAYPIAAIFGANASGKSALIDALHYTFEAIRLSATRWQARDRTPRVPFALDDTSRKSVSTYILDFVLNDVRHEYGFAVGPDGIAREWLKDLPGSRWRTVFTRDGDSTEIRMLPSMKSLGGVTSRELALSRAILLDHPQLGPIGRGLLEGFEITPLDEKHRERRLSAITESLASGRMDFEDIVTLMRIADIGVEEVSVREDTLPPDAVELMGEIRKLIDEKRSVEEKVRSRDSHTEFRVEAIDSVVRNLEFVHRSSCKEAPRFSIQRESEGTIAWLSLIVPALDVLRNGGLFCVDEIDASLHSHLVGTLIGFFADSNVNHHAAQLVFTSHDTYLLSPLSEIELEPEQVWFTEKDNAGATELICLADFPRHKDANVAKRYLSGRYGAVPRIAPSAILRLLEPRDTQIETEVER